MVEAIRDCEALVAAVARAFYPDDVAIVLDALIRDRYVREDEMGRRLRMSARQARKLLQLLEGERLVDFEVLDVGADGKLKKKKKELGHEIGKAGDAGPKVPAPPAANEIYWYVDLARFVDVIRWRVHTMRETIRKRECRHSRINFQMWPLRRRPKLLWMRSGTSSSVPSGCAWASPTLC